jgi:hypothetical protein
MPQSRRWKPSLPQRASGIRPTWPDFAAHGSSHGAAMIGIKPSDEIEGMLAAQMVATHNAAMECFRRAMLREQSFEGRRENLTQANKLTRSCAMLLEALNRHRGKG